MKDKCLDMSTEKGWICLHREITEHWLWSDAVKLKWWLDILLSVNHKDQKVLIGNKLFDCKRGQSVMSLSNWGKRWGVSKSKVDRFFDLLIDDGIIVKENLTKTIRITICNYENYQEARNRKETDVIQTCDECETEARTNNNVNNDNNEENVNKIYNLYPTRCVVKGSSTGKSVKNKEKIKALLKTMSEDKLSDTIKWYVDECTKNKTYMKNFTTFLNNLPEIPEDRPASTNKLYHWMCEPLGIDRKGTYEQYEADVKRNKGYEVKIIGDVR